MCLHIIARESWQAERPRTTQFLNNPIFPVVNVASTYTNTLPCHDGHTCRKAVFNLQHKAIKLKFQEDIYYSFLIGGDGMVYEGRGWWTCPILPFRHRFHNKDTVYIGYIGKFIDKKPSVEMRRARHELIQYGIAMGLISEDYELRDISGETSALPSDTLVRKIDFYTRNAPDQ